MRKRGKTEVDSGGDRQKTINKLVLGMIDQLCWLRNRNDHDTLLKCSGFYFMSHNGWGRVIHVDLKWIDDQFRLNASEIQLKMEDVACTIQHVFCDEKRFSTVQGQINANFTHPISIS